MHRQFPSRYTRDLRAVQDMLGHADPKTTARHTRVVDMAKYNPPWPYPSHSRVWRGMMSTERIVAATRGVFQGIEIVTRHMADRAIPLLQAEANPTERERRLKDLYLRVFCWMQTLNKLSDPRDFQAIVACNRSLFESTVDIILLSQGTGPYAPERMYWWEKSAKLVAAEALVRYFTKAKQRIPDDWQAQANFIQENQDEILKKRLELWPRKDNKPKHPMRWTGAPDLLTDARTADQLRQAEISQDLETSLTEFHETQMRRINFTVHGSASP